jgi:hypothetical protein
MKKRYRADMWADEVIDDAYVLDKAVREALEPVKSVGTYLIQKGKRQGKYWYRMIVTIKENTEYYVSKKIRNVLEKNGFTVIKEEEK